MALGLEVILVVVLVEMVLFKQFQVILLGLIRKQVKQLTIIFTLSTQLIQQILSALLVRVIHLLAQVIHLLAIHFLVARQLLDWLRLECSLGIMECVIAQVLLLALILMEIMFVWDIEMV